MDGWMKEKNEESVVLFNSTSEQNRATSVAPCRGLCGAAEGSSFQIHN